MRVDDRAANCQAHAHPGLLRCEERAKDTGNRVVGNAASRVFHPDNDLLAGGAGIDFQPMPSEGGDALPHRIKGVADEIDWHATVRLALPIGALSECGVGL